MIKIFFFPFPTIFSSPRINPPFFGGGGWSERNHPAVKSNRKWRAACDKVGDAGGKRDAFCLSQSVPPRCTAETIPPVSSFEHGDGMERNLLQLPRRHGKLDFFLEWPGSPYVRCVSRVCRRVSNLDTRRVHDPLRSTIRRPCSSSRVHPRGTKRTMDELWDGIHARGYVSGPW